MIKSKEGQMGRAGSTNWGYRLLVRMAEGKRLVGRSRCRCMDNNKIYLGEIGWSSVVWTGLSN
jgi:hypothetical protein